MREMDKYLLAKLAPMQEKCFTGLQTGNLYDSHFYMTTKNATK